MGHVSDFNGMNECTENDLSQASSELLSADNILDLHLTDNLLPISNTFTDDIYRASSLYMSGNLPSLTEDDRNGYFDEPMFDLLFDSEHSFNIDFDATDSILGTEPILESGASDILETTESEKNGNFQVNEVVLKKPVEEQIITNQNNSYSVSDCNENCLNVDNCCESNTADEVKSCSTETFFKASDSSNVKEEQKPIPKLIIRLKPEKKVTEPELPTEMCLPLTIADNVKLGRRRNGSLKPSNTKNHSLQSDDGTYKKKSRHKKHQHSVEGANKQVSDINKNFKTKLLNCSSVETNGKVFQLEKTSSNGRARVSKNYSMPKVEDLSPQLSNNSLLEAAPSIQTFDFYSYNNEYNNIATDNSVDKGKENNLSPVKNKCEDVSFDFDFKDSGVLSLTSSADTPKELNNSVEDIFEDFDITVDDENIPDSNKSLTDDDVESSEILESSKENSFSDMTDQGAICSPAVNESFVNVVDTISSNKCNSVSDLVNELHAHNQQVFEEIEISTPELELELGEGKNSNRIETSLQLQPSANDIAPKQYVASTEHGENDMNSQNHIHAGKNSSSFHTSKTASAFNSPNSSHNSAAHPRNISSSSSSVTSKSSTSHRSYRKRRSSRASSSSSSSDREKFYNRPVKYDPVTDTYCDEFGREIRENELMKYKLYLGSKLSHRDSHSNNGSSSSTVSRSRSPRHKNYHRKHHKSRSNSRSHRKRRYSSSHSRSRSRSRGRRRKDDSEKRYRSPSPRHRRRPHYMDLEENVKANEERRVMYVGDIPPGYTVEQLKERFGRFGPIQDATIKSKTTSDFSLYIFGFVTFKNRSDACNAIENGNKNPLWPKFDLNFGGRRRFCNGNYTDLDGKVAEAESGWYGHRPSYRQAVKQEDDFAELLRLEQRRIGMQKK